MKLRKRSFIPGLAVVLSMLAAPSLAADESVVTSRWKLQEIKYNYVGYTTAYDCDAFEDRLEKILIALGAHPSTKVRAQGCPGPRPAHNFFVTITTASPIPADELPQADASRQELLKRLNTKAALATEEFPATWKSIELAKEKRLNITPGDCEMLEGLRDRVLPKLSIKIESDRLSCSPNQVGILPPHLRVSALVPLKNPDA